MSVFDNCEIIPFTEKEYQETVELLKRKGLCLECMGLGQIPNDAYNDSFDSTVETSLKCLTCSGTGIYK